MDHKTHGLDRIAVLSHELDQFSDQHTKNGEFK